jgi:hypothetical protein
MYGEGELLPVQLKNMNPLHGIDTGGADSIHTTDRKMLG